MAEKRAGGRGVRVRETMVFVVIENTETFTMTLLDAPFSQILSVCPVWQIFGILLFFLIIHT